MKKAFSLLELIVVLSIIALITSFVVMKSNDSIDFSIKTKIKSDISMIRSSISKKISKQILLNSEDKFILDNASSNENNSKLFSNILDFPLISTTKDEKKMGDWIKSSQDEYMVYVAANEYLEFEFDDNSFKCKSNLSLCKEYE